MCRSVTSYPWFPEHSYRLWDLPSLLYSGYRGWIVQGMKLTTHLNLTPRWRMRGAFTSTPCMCSLRALRQHNVEVSYLIVKWLIRLLPPSEYSIAVNNNNNYYYNYKTDGKYGWGFASRIAVTLCVVCVCVCVCVWISTWYFLISCTVKYVLRYRPLRLCEWHRVKLKSLDKCWKWYPFGVVTLVRCILCEFV